MLCVCASALLVRKVYQTYKKFAKILLYVDPRTFLGTKIPGHVDILDTNINHINNQYLMIPPFWALTPQERYSKGVPGGGRVFIYLSSG